MPVILALTILMLRTRRKVIRPTLFDAAFTYEIIKGTDVAVNVRNLFDEQHAVGVGTVDYYNPGREVIATLSYSW